MRLVVTDGTGRNANIPGLDIRGKTGTAELDNSDMDNSWFVGFINRDDMPFAVCVAVEKGGTGGTTAAPIARHIFTWIRDNAATLSEK